MIFQIPVQKRPIILEIFLYSPLVILLCLFCITSLATFTRLSSVEGLFGTLFSGSVLSQEEAALLDSLTTHDIEAIMSPWGESRRKAANLIMGYNGYRGPDFDSMSEERSTETDSDAPAGDGSVSRLIESGSYSEAEALLQNLFDLGEYFENPSYADDFFLNLRKVVLKTESYRDWLDRLIPGEEESGYGKSFFLATAHEKLGDWDEALIWYNRAEELSKDWEELRRVQWYTLRLMTRQFPGLLAGFFDSAGIFRNDGAYFDDALDELFSVLIRQRRWNEFAALLPHIRNAGLTEAASQGLFLLEKGREEGYVSISEPLDEGSGFTPDPKGYYALRSQPDSWPGLNPKSPSPAMPGADAMDEVYQILIDAGYQEEVYRLWDENRETLSLETVKSLCRYLESKGDLYELIRFAGFWYYTYPAEQALVLLPWVYPGAERYAITDESIPQELVLGIIRRESAFHESIFSFAGAGGLMQLMPSTAEDLARKNRLENWNLLKADDNILLGTLYLKWLRERPWTSSYVDVLAAYNGGGGNLRSWKRRLGYDDPDLFIQSIPFRETRDYVRKVIVAAATYRYLDTGSPPGDWVEQFYRSF